MKTLNQLKADVQTLQTHLYGVVKFIPETEEHCKSLINHYKESFGVIL